MRKALYGLILLGFFVLEGSLMPWLLPARWQSDVHVAPHLVLVALVYMALYTGRHTSLMVGIAMGFLQDIVFYGHMVGVHAFALGLCGYFAGLLMMRGRKPFWLTMSVMWAACLLFELVIYAVYRVFKVTPIPFNEAFSHIMLPSIIITLFIALVAYIPLHHVLERLYTARDDRDAHTGV